jgi:glutaredoxin
MSTMTQRFCDKSGEPLSLVLYMFDECPFCQRVLSAMGALGFDLPMRNIRKDLSARDELIRVGGSKQVPCLFINGKPLYESADIIDYLKTEVRRA